jgi:hypothetical protein
MDKVNEIRGGRYALIAQALLPFVTTPWNLIRFGLKMTPGVGTVGLAMDFKSGNTRRITKGLAQQVIGGAIWLLLAAYNDPYDEDAYFRITGSKHSQYRNKKLTDTSRSKPFHVYIGDMSFDYSRFDPWATVFGVAVDTVEDIKRAKNADDVARAVNTYGASIARAVNDKTFPHHYCGHHGDGGPTGRRARLQCRADLGAIVRCFAHGAQYLAKHFSGR